MSTTIHTMEARMPPGFRFHPRDSELVLDYLLQKLTGGGGGGGVAMVDVDLNNCEPWELPEESCVGGKTTKEWYFFSLRGRKYATGDRTDRATRSGYWKATGKDRAVVAAAAAATPRAVVGMRKTLVFYRGRAPRGRKTEWVMHEFRLQPQFLLLTTTSKEDWVLCRVFLKSKISRTTTTPPAPPRPPPSGGDQACGLPSYCEPGQLPAADPAVTTSYSAFVDSSPIIIAAEQVPCFRRPPPPVSLLGDLLAVDDDDDAMGIIMTGSTVSSSSGLELAPASWEEQESDHVQMWYW